VKRRREWWSLAAVSPLLELAAASGADGVTDRSPSLPAAASRLGLSPDVFFSPTSSAREGDAAATTPFTDSNLPNSKTAPSSIVSLFPNPPS